MEIAGVSPRFVDLPESTDPIRYAIDQNERRRHSTASERAIVAANLANLKHGGDRRSDQGANLPLEKPPPISIPQAAEMLRVSPRLVKDAILLKTHGTDEENELVRSNKASVSAVARRLECGPSRRARRCIFFGPAAARGEGRERQPGSGRAQGRM